MEDRNIDPIEDFVVQDGFPGLLGAEPMVLTRAVNTDRELVARQVMGCLASLFAPRAKVPAGPGDRLPIQLMLRDTVREAGQIVEWDEDEFSQRV